jgi:hypothetical protein
MALLKMALLRGVRNPVNRVCEIVRHQYGAIIDRNHINRAAVIVSILIDPAFSKRHSFTRRAIGIYRGKHDPGAYRYRPVPRSVLGRENAAAIFLRKHFAGVKAHPEIGSVGNRF